jgi:hypothetical protein
MACFMTDGSRNRHVLHKLSKAKIYEKTDLDHLFRNDGKPDLCPDYQFYKDRAMNINIVVAIVVFALIAGLCLGWYIRKLIELQERLEKQVAELSQIANRRKLPYPAQAGIEDVIAIVGELLDDDEARTAYQNTRKSQLFDRLVKLRNDPQGYDINEASNAPRKGK